MRQSGADCQAYQFKALTNTETQVHNSVSHDCYDISYKNKYLVLATYGQAAGSIDVFIRNTSVSPPSLTQTINISLAAIPPILMT